MVLPELMSDSGPVLKAEKEANEYLTAMNRKAAVNSAALPMVNSLSSTATIIGKPSRTRWCSSVSGEISSIRQITSEYWASLPLFPAALSL